MMVTGWRPSIGDYVALSLEPERVGSYVIRGTSGDRLLLHEVWCEAGRLRESTRRREVRWTDVRDLRRIEPPQC